MNIEGLHATAQRIVSGISADHIVVSPFEVSCLQIFPAARYKPAYAGEAATKQVLDGMYVGQLILAERTVDVYVKPE